MAAFAIGTNVRWRVGAELGNFEVAPGSEWNANSPMIVVLANPDNKTGYVLLRRETTILGIFPDTDLVEVPAPVDNPPGPLVPDAII